MHKRNIRKNKTDKENCFNLVNLFFTNTFKEYIKSEQLSLDLNALSKQENDIEIYYRKKRNEEKHHYASIVACTTKLLRKILVLCKQLDK